MLCLESCNSLYEWNLEQSRLRDMTAGHKRNSQWNIGHRNSIMAVASKKIINVAGFDIQNLYIWHRLPSLTFQRRIQNPSVPPIMFSSVTAGLAPDRSQYLGHQEWPRHGPSLRMIFLWVMTRPSQTASGSMDLWSIRSSNRFEFSPGLCFHGLGISLFGSQAKMLTPRARGL